MNTQKLQTKKCSEPLFMEDPERYSTLPILPGREPIIKLYEKQQASFWKAKQVDMSEDQKHWKEGLLYPNTTEPDQIHMNEKAKEFISYILAFFSSADLLVIKNLDENFTRTMKWLEVQKTYDWQRSMEYVHSDAYALQIDALITDPNTKTKIFNAIKEIPCVTKKAEWIYHYMDATVDDITKLVALACLEGILFSGEFCAIFWLKSINRMPGLSKYNDLISKDEGMHTDFACLLYTNYVRGVLSEARIHEIIKSAVDVECEFILEAISCSMIGMNKTHMETYIKFVANRLCLQLGYNEAYPKIENPFSFMNKISLELKQNFFEGRPTNYNIATVSDTSKNIYSDDADF